MVKLFKWKKELESGIAMIDSQHKELFKLMNSLFIRGRMGLSVPVLEGFITRFENYQLYHYQTEDTFQKESGYPQLQEHRALHQMLSFEGKRLMLRLREQGPSPALLDESYRFLVEMTQHHVLTADMDFIRYYRAHSQGGQEAGGPGEEGPWQP